MTTFIVAWAALILLGCADGRGLRDASKADADADHLPPGGDVIDEPTSALDADLYPDTADRPQEIGGNDAVDSDSELDAVDANDSDASDNCRPLRTGCPCPPEFPYICCFTIGYGAYCIDGTIQEFSDCPCIPEGSWPGWECGESVPSVLRRKFATGIV